MMRAGAAAASARAGLVMLHGRGGSAEDMLELGHALALPELALLAPEAPGRSWWPVSFLAPMSELAGWLDAALNAVRGAVDVLEAEGLPRRSISVFGLSQGGCLALEFAAREGAGLAAVFCFSGALIGTGDAEGAPRDDLYGYTPKAFDYTARLDGLRVEMSCHQRDPHIPLARFNASAARLAEMGARVQPRVHAGAGHGLTQGDIASLRGVLNAA